MIFIAVVFACVSGQCQFAIDPNPAHDKAAACEARIAEMVAELAAVGIRSQGACLPVPVTGV